MTEMETWEELLMGEVPEGVATLTIVA